eukprot:jgi/Mesvir1/3278/Mv25611-RA.1
MLHSSLSSFRIIRWMALDCAACLPKSYRSHHHPNRRPGRAGPGDCSADGHHRSPTHPARRQMIIASQPRTPATRTCCGRSGTASTTDGIATKLQEFEALRQAKQREATDRALAASAEWCCVVSPRSQVRRQPPLPTSS